MDTARLVTAFGTDDTVQFFEGQRFSKSVFLMRYRGPSDLTDPKIFFTYDLKLDNVSIGQELYLACQKFPLLLPFFAKLIMPMLEVWIAQVKRWTSDLGNMQIELARVGMKWE